MTAEILRIEYVLPDKVLDNAELEKLYTNWTAEKIFEKTGIRQRRVTSEDETALDLAERAGKKLLKEGGYLPSSIDFLLLCTCSPDYFMPASACILQDRLALPKTCGALDYNLGCSGFVYGLSLAKGLIAGGLASRVLLITSETLTKHIHPMDKSVRTIFGDAAAATIIGASDEGRIGQFVFGTDGSGHQNLIIPAGGMRLPRSAETAVENADESDNIRSKDNFYMNGPEVFNFTLDVVPGMVEETLVRNGLRKDDIDLFVFHQANLFMLNVLRKTIKIPKEKFFISMEDIGNTVSATIPVALARAEVDGVLRKGMKVMLVGFGVGLSWGATVIEW